MRFLLPVSFSDFFNHWQTRSIFCRLAAANGSNKKWRRQTHWGHPQWNEKSITYLRASVFLFSSLIASSSGSLIQNTRTPNWSTPSQSPPSECRWSSDPISPDLAAEWWSASGRERLFASPPCSSSPSSSLPGEIPERATPLCLITICIFVDIWSPQLEHKQLTSKFQNL